MHVVRRPSLGFTLIELLVVLTILGVMLGIGIPSFRDFVANQSVTTASSDLATAMLMGRSEAIKRNRDAVLAPTDGAWSKGWTVKVKVIVSGVEEDRTILEREKAGDLTFTVCGGASGACTAAPTSIVFKSSGRVDDSSTVRLQIGSSSNAIRCIRLDSSGVANVTRAACQTS